MAASQRNRAGQYTPEAERQVDDLRRFYEERDRIEAAQNLDLALGDAESRIAAQPEDRLRAPRLYPVLARQGWAWIKAGRYWVAYSTTWPPVIVGVFDESSDIPGRA